MSRTLQVWVDGEQFVVRDEEVDEFLEIGAKADTPDEAWERAYEWLLSK